MTDLELLQHRFDRERRARLEAESLLEAKSLELFELNEELRRLNETLERRVSDRTAELSETNSRLLREMEEREKAETRFRLAVEASPNGKIIVNRAGLIVMVNSKAEQQFGYQRDQLVGQPVEILVPAAVRSGHAALREHFFTAIHSRPMGGGRALAAQRRDGSIFPAELSLNPIETADGLQVLVSIVDITARLESERQLRQREQELSDFFDNAAVGLHWLGPDGVIKRANRAELDMLGYSDSEYVGQHASAFHVDQSAFTEMLNRLLSGQTVQNYEVRMRTRSGLIKHVALTSNSYFEDGVFQHSRCFMVDITERKLAEEKLAESSRMALFTARICESLIHGGTLRVTLGICADLILEHLDGVWARIWVHNPEENRLELQARAGDELPCDRFYKLISGGESKIHRIAKTRRPLVSNAVADDCHELCSEVTEQHQIASFAGFPLILQDRLVGVVALYSRREVTTAVQECLTSVSNAIAVGIDRFQTESRLEYAKEAAESASRTKNEFLANMSHELRTPLTAITGYADLLSAPEQRSTQDIKWARQILRSARHLGMLLDDILDLAKVEAGRIKVENRPCEIKSLVEEVAEMFRPQAIEKLLEFRVEHDPAIPQWILLDPTRLRQVLTNLVSNALKFTQVGRVQIIVKRRYSESVTEDDEIEISVVDSGVGMTTDQLQQLFQPFQRLHQQTLTVPGTGLGLAISHRLVELMRGRFDIASEPAKGTRFSIILPLQEVAADYSRLESGSAILSRPLPRLSSRVGKEDELRGLRVLLVDDNPDNVSIFVHMLEPLGIHVTVAGNGREAVYAVVGQIASKTPFEMILMDMQMPIMDGAEATRELRRRQVQTPVIALTAFAMAEDQERCREAGCDLFLTKPVLRSKLISALWEAMSLPGFKRMTSVARPPVAPPPAPAVPVTPPAPTGDFGELLQRYRVSLRRQLAQIESAQAAGASDDICKTAHRLKGTAANYGFPQITECAARCEDQLRQGATLQQISRDLAKLKASISAVVGNE